MWILIDRGRQCALECSRLQDSIGSLGIGTYISTYVPPSGSRPPTTSSTPTRSRARSRSTVARGPAPSSTSASASVSGSGISSGTSVGPEPDSNLASTTGSQASGRLPPDWAHPIATATLQTTVFDIVHLFSDLGISAVPIIDDQGRVIDLYETVDVVDLVRPQAYNQLDLTVADALRRRAPDHPGIVTCSPDDSLAAILAYVRERRVHRFVIVEPETPPAAVAATAMTTPPSTNSNTTSPRPPAGAVPGRLVGLLCLSDVLRHLVGLAPDELKGHEIEGLGHLAGATAGSSIPEDVLDVSRDMDGLGIREGTPVVA